MSRRWRPVAYFLSAVAMGLLVGQLMVHGLRGPRETVTIDLRSSDLDGVDDLWVSSNPAAAPEAAPPGRTIPSSLASAPSSLSGPSAVLPEWLPQVQPMAPLRGASGAWVPHSAEWSTTRVVLLPSGPELDGLALRVRTKDRAEYVDQVRASLERRARRPKDPWESSAFQYVGTLGLPRNLSVTGRDFLPMASPELSVRWMEAARRVELPDGRRQAALDLLRRFEGSRKAALAAISDRAYQLAGDPKFEYPCLAYAWVSGQLFVFREKEAPDIDAIAASIQATDREIRVHAATVLGR